MAPDLKAPVWTTGGTGVFLDADRRKSRDGGIGCSEGEQSETLERRGLRLPGARGSLWSRRGRRRVGLFPRVGILLFRILSGVPGNARLRGIGLPLSRLMAAISTKTSGGVSVASFSRDSKMARNCDSTQLRFDKLRFDTAIRYLHTPA
jgi:hypothetical protein